MAQTDSSTGVRSEPAAAHSPDPDDVNYPTLDPVVNEAWKRFKRTFDWNNHARKLFIEDLKFAHADSENNYQWPNVIRRNRDVDERPCLTINQTRQHNLQIINDAKQNKPGVKVTPVGNDATKEAADVMMGLVRHIEYISNASVAYDTATEFQVEAGLGYIRLVTDYASAEGFEQEIYIRRIVDPLTVLMDPDAQQKDRSDARFAFLFIDVPRDIFDQKYGKYKNIATSNIFGEDAWIDEHHVRIAEYYRVIEEDDELVSWIDRQSGQRLMLRKSKMPKNVYSELTADPSTRTRPIKVKKVEWFKIIGHEVVEEKTIPGTSIPIVPVIGSEWTIDGIYDCCGHTRQMKDPQRTYNYWTSCAVEFGALQGKTPWVGPAKAMEGYETYYESANRVNHAYLPYNHWDDEAAQIIPPPQRAQPPVMADAYLKGMQVASQELMMVSGQYQAQMGEQGNERSGKAIAERQRQGDNSTYHFIDNLAIAIRRVGKIIVEWIPEIYDTKRIVQILAVDGTSQLVEIDPSARQVYQQELDNAGKVAKRILNPTIGTYEVQADVGPAYATKREEAFNAFTLILTQNPQLAGVIGDIMMRAGDFPMAEEAAERLRRLVPPQALGQGPSPQEQQLQMQVQNLQGLLAKTMQELGTERLKLKGKDELRDIDVYDAETKRLTALQKMLPMDAEGLKQLIHETVQEALTTSLQPVLQANQQEDNIASGEAQLNLPLDETPVPGAQKAPDGQWYLLDPTKKGRYLRVGALAQERRPPGG